MGEEEEEQQLLHIELDGDDDEKKKSEKEKRRICISGCGRPSNVCLCSQLPSKPISTNTQIVILHHPHEFRHKLATVPILTKCLSNTQTLIGRRLNLGSSSILDSLYADATSKSHRRAIFLFPGTESSPSVELKDWAASSSSCQSNNVILIVFDGTWKHAREMVKASLPFLSKFATQVCFNYDVALEGDSKFESELVLRKEPFSGCMSTIEAVARALRLLEPQAGLEIQDSLISVLKAMVHFQSLHFKPSKLRPRLSKKTRIPH